MAKRREVTSRELCLLHLVGISLQVPTFRNVFALAKEFVDGFDEDIQLRIVLPQRMFTHGQETGGGGVSEIRPDEINA